jgi:predicted site-specific integrase-resolvase
MTIDTNETIENNYGFDVQKEFSTLKTETDEIRKRSYTTRKSRLDKFGFELLELKKAGNTVAELKRFLRAKRMKVSHSTISRWLRKNV